MPTPEMELCLINAIYEASPDGILVIDENGIVVSHNRRFVEIAALPRALMRGPEPGTFIGMDSAILLAAVVDTMLDKPAFLARVDELTRNPELTDFSELKLLNGHTIERHSTALTSMGGQAMGRVWFLRDITMQLQSAESMRKLALYDRLTGLPNRRLLLERLNQAFAASARSGREGAVLFIDLDNFKDINNTAGHDIGDALLQQTAERLLACVSSADTVARLTGDEFVVMLEDLKPRPENAAIQSQAVGERIIAALDRPYCIGDQQFHCKASIGATVFSDHEHTGEELLNRADIAMFQAKKSGHNLMHFFNPKMQEIISRRATLDADLHKALGNNEFRLYFQIQVDAANRPRGAEALIRWLHPLRGLVPPLEFIPLAEESGMILPIGAWVLDTACAQLAAWQAHAHMHGLSLAINVSSLQFRQADFVAQVQAAIARHGITAARLKLELTESMLVGNIEDAIIVMNALKRVGVRFSLDDFGTGYSSLQYLMRLPVDQLKIDQSFIRDLARNKNGRAIVRTIIAMAKSLNLDVIAEGVETAEERHLLLGKGCTNFQGFLFGKPVPIAQFEAQLEPVWQ